jgi:Co/Zn/Cd efflux system component
MAGASAPTGYRHDDWCSSPKGRELNRPRWRRAPWIALRINAGLFLAEIVVGVAAGSPLLQADTINFPSDSANYAVSLGVAGMAPTWRAPTALLKGWSLGLLGVRSRAPPGRTSSWPPSWPHWA